MIMEKLVAAKKLDRMVRGVEVEFETEVSAIGRTNHKNLVQLLGFCNEEQHRLLVYEFMSNGSLATFLFGNSRPDWYRRTQIILGTARGLLYLHEECSTQTIHCDIKPQNILLDDFLTARISDFGLAKLLKTDQTQTTTGIRGTKGYVAPEWFKTVPVTAKVDVYSFGIVLLELIFCRKNFEPAVEDENQMVLADWAYDSYLERKLDLLVEKDQEALDNMEKLEKFVMIAIWCIQEDPSQRPTMKKVTQMLEGAIEVPLPPDPSPFSKSFPHQPLLCRRKLIQQQFLVGNATLGSSLTAEGNNSFWASPSDEYAFGFQQIRNEGFLLAIWFNKIPEKTIVWSANGNNLVQRGSRVELTTGGQFVLNDPEGKQIWNAVYASKVSYAAMLDTGNFVLASQDSIYLWESFDHPTDTILPTQMLDLGSQLVARFSEKNYSNGRFLLILQADGDLILYTTAFQQILHYVYPKSADSSREKWPMAWYPLSFIPENICMSITAGTGSGACGFNSYCELGDDQRPNCKCPPGYSFLDPDNTMSGCKQNFVTQNCEKASQEKDQFYLEEMINTDWPLADYEYFRPVTEDWCREACLGDCFCAVAIFRNGKCWKKKIPLSNGRIDPSVGGKALIKTRI
ncbi:G-type lectin S-receptor-like serine/threonine-protein kinase LECRK1 [Vitis vinifera]|uniref:G-type lectin S-receptor-like serine/threonine-protein kinase LECRK1 n=1 Tax=Vitis vinifera TaxID=29760 RepID=A0A438JUU8_VITVI|nr:G-type lectin S-receptor-like serine/threonine-protein kinase LECRK1 [Vitis vinifera]